MILRNSATRMGLLRLNDIAGYENPTVYCTGSDYVDKGRRSGAKPGKALRGAGVKAAAEQQSP